MFTLFVADNFHYMDEEETYQCGEFDTWTEAVQAARQIVDEFLADAIKQGVSPGAVYSHYTLFGEDPYIVPTPDGEHFSAWKYAEQRSQELSQAGGQ